MKSDIKLYKGLLGSKISNTLTNKLINDVKFQHELTLLSGGSQRIRRGMAYISNKVGWYKFSHFAVRGTSWEDYPTYMKVLRNIVSRHVGVVFNSVLLNHYKNGKDEIRWHSDKEDILGPNPVIACLNFGASRTLHFLSKSETEPKEKISHLLESGDLLVMGKDCQQNWLHAVLPEKEIKEPRISLTFRKTIYDISSG